MNVSLKNTDGFFCNPVPHPIRLEGDWRVLSLAKILFSTRNKKSTKKDTFYLYSKWTRETIFEPDLAGNQLSRASWQNDTKLSCGKYTEV